MSKMESGSSGASASRGSGRSGPRASLACLNCRQRKIKCRMPDPNASACQSCLSLKLPCIVNKDGDRRKAGSRQHVAALQERLDYLESYIANSQQGVPAGQPAEMDAMGATSAPGMFLPDAGPQMSPASLSAHRPSFDNGSTVTSDSISSSRSIPGSQGSQVTPPAPMSIRSAGRNTPPRQIMSNSSSHQTDLGRLTPSTDKDPSRLDVDEADGQPRFYGPTSQAHIQRHGVPVESEELTAEDEKLNIDSLPLRSVLLTNYWKIQPHSIVIVDESLFLQGRESGRRSEYYSQFLEDALLASASRMSTSSGVRALGPKYVERAKTVIAQELERPNTATLQGFLLLSDFEATRGRDRLGYLYCGIGCRLVFDLGLHESCADLVTKGNLSVPEARWRHTLFLGSFVYDKLWSLYTGRPGTIPIATVETAHNRSLGSGWTGPATLDPWMRLCSDMSQMTDILNGTSPVTDEAKRHLMSLDSTIQMRFEALPPELVLHKDRVSELPPIAYSLHIQFHGIRIILNRLLYKSAAQEAFESPSDADHRNFDLERSRAIMYENALQISQLISVYLQIFGIEQVITIMLDNTYVAAMVLISSLLRTLQQDPTPQTVERDMQRLRVLADLLAHSQRHYPVTVRMRYSLASLVENTPIAGMFGTFAKRSTEEQSNGAVTGLASDSNMQQSVGYVATDPFQDFHNGLRPDMAYFEDWGGDGGGIPMLWQDLSMQDMMSWGFTPNSVRNDITYQ